MLATAVNRPCVLFERRVIKRLRLSFSSEHPTTFAVCRQGEGAPCNQWGSCRFAAALGATPAPPRHTCPSVTPTHKQARTVRCQRPVGAQLTWPAHSDNRGHGDGRHPRCFSSVCSWRHTARKGIGQHPQPHALTWRRLACWMCRMQPRLGRDDGRGHRVMVVHGLEVIGTPG